MGLQINVWFLQPDIFKYVKFFKNIARDFTHNLGFCICLMPGLYITQDKEITQNDTQISIYCTVAEGLSIRVPGVVKSMKRIGFG
jgi:hypothetical protein